MKFYAHKTTGAFLGAHNVAPANGVETPAPAHGSQIWNGAAWAGAVPPPPVRDVLRLVDELQTEGVLTATRAAAIKARIA